MKTRVPEPAERARTLAMRASGASLMPAADEGTKVSPYLHHVHDDGSATILLSDRDPLVGVAWQSPRTSLTAMLELTDTAPLPLREPVRGLLWLTGVLTALDDHCARERAMEVAEVHADPRLLDVGHGMTVLRLDPASIVLADGEGSASLDVEEFLQACPDPFHDYESGWLRHLELSHRDVVGQLSKHLPDPLQGAQVRPLGLDRWGLRLRVEAVDGDHDVRLSFERPVYNPAQLAIELRRLVGCPFLAGSRS